MKIKYAHPVYLNSTIIADAYRNVSLQMNQVELILLLLSFRQS